MKTYEVVIKPVSGFGTPLKGDTLFGHFCWQIAYDSNLAKKSLDELLSTYHTTPFAVFSSAYPKICLKKDGEIYYVLKTPALPVSSLFKLPENKAENIRRRKELKNKCWMLVKRTRSTLCYKSMNL